MAKIKKFIQAIGLKKGALHDYLGVPQGTKLTVAQLQKAQQAGGRVGQMAQFALNARNFKHPSKKGAKASKRSSRQVACKKPVTSVKEQVKQAMKPMMMRKQGKL